jgi:hypothetical protein
MHTTDSIRIVQDNVFHADLDENLCVINYFNKYIMK